MRAIVGRLTDLGLRELLRLLNATSAAGELSLRNDFGEATVRVAAGMVEGPVNRVTVTAFHRRDGSFSFRPTPLEAGVHWQPMEEFLARLSREAPPSEQGMKDFLTELRESLREVSPSALGRVLVVTGDPRPYRALEVDWAKRGWQVTITAVPSWPADQTFDVAVLHLPGSATLAGQGEAWLNLLTKASEFSPPVPVVWVGGLADAYLRHQAVQRGAAFLMPAPAGEAGEAARWFREDLSVCLERLFQQRALVSQGPGMVLQEFFVALHSDTPAEEARASLLRLAANSFQRGVLLACTSQGFEVLGGFGCSSLPYRVPRGVAFLEELVAQGRAHLRVRIQEPLLSFVLSSGEDAAAYPIKVQGRVVGVLLASGAQEGAHVQELVGVAAGAGALLGLKASSLPA